jgi:8-oxo-dGTP pyrophosphatase MutT (NUDIX family)
MTTLPEATPRESIRAILLTPQDEILLLRIRKPGTGEYLWITPGGGREAGESIEETLRRELHEELGLRTFEMGPLVWTRQHTFEWAGKRICQDEKYFVVTAARFEPVMSDEAELKVLDCFRWWPDAELRNSVDRLVPPSLPDLVTEYLDRRGTGLE